MIKDIIKAFIIGCILAAVCTAAGIVTGLIMHGMSHTAVLDTAKNILFVLGAAGLFVLAGMLLVKGKKPEKSYEQNGWRKHFAILEPRPVIAIISAAVLAAGIILDYLSIALL